MHLILTMKETLKSINGSRKVEMLTRDKGSCEGIYIGAQDAKTGT